MLDSSELLTTTRSICALRLCCKRVMDAHAPPAPPSPRARQDPRPTRQRHPWPRRVADKCGHGARCTYVRLRALKLYGLGLSLRRIGKTKRSKFLCI